MDLFLGALISGIAVGALYGLLGFALSLLYRSTGIINFAQGTIGTVGAFIIYTLATAAGLPSIAALPIGLVGGAVTAALAYFIGLRPREGADHLNLVMRTLAIQIILLALLRNFFAVGEPYIFPSIFPNTPAFTIGLTVVSWQTVSRLGVAAVLVVLFALFFRLTKTGLMLLGLADRADIASLLGVRTRRLTVIAWAVAGAVSVIVAVMVAPSSLLSTGMMESYVLLAFTGAMIGGLNSFVGVFVGGFIVGIIQTVVSVFIGPAEAAVVLFCALLAFLTLKPDGLFGKHVAERL